MLFKNVLDEKYRTMIPIFNDLLEMALNNQTHVGDLLLLHENAGYNKEYLKHDNLGYPPDFYVIGLQVEGHSDITHYNFIGDYVNKSSKIIQNDYLDLVKYDKDRVEEINDLEQKETMSVQIEMLIYIKIWESDTFIKKMYQLARVINGEDYDWHFKVKGHDKKDTGGFTRSVLLNNHIINRFEHTLPKLHRYLYNSYNTQIRNAIAHSQYFIVGRNITFNNHRSNNVDSMSHITFDNWCTLFHETIMLYSMFNDFLNKVNNIYYDLSQENGKSIETRINRTYPIKETKFFRLYTRDHFKDWSPHKSED